MVIAGLVLVAQPLPDPHGSIDTVVLPGGWGLDQVRKNTDVVDWVLEKMDAFNIKIARMGLLPAIRTAGFEFGMTLKIRNTITEIANNTAIMPTR